MAHIEIPQAGKWSAGVMCVMFQGRSVLDHICEAAFEARVFDKSTVGTKKEKFATAAAVVQRSVLSHITFTMRLGFVLCIALELHSDVI